jgi:hypothetical protein
MDDDDRALIGLKSAEAALDRVAVGEAGGWIASDRVMCVCEPDLHRPTPTPSEHVRAGPDEEPPKPGVESIGIAKGGQIPPGADEGLLDRVLRRLGVARDESSNGIEPGSRGACQALEGVMIASSRPFHEFPVHLALDPARPGGRVHPQWRTDPAEVFPESHILWRGLGSTDRIRRSPCAAGWGKLRRLLDRADGELWARSSTVEQVTLKQPRLNAVVA